MEICTAFYKQLYSDKTKDESDPEYIRTEDIPYITGYEVEAALKTMTFNLPLNQPLKR